MPLERNFTRRNVLTTVGFSAAALASCGDSEAVTARNGRIKHSVAHWCYTATDWKWSFEKTCEVAKSLGCQSVELASPEQLPIVQDFGLQCAIAPNGMPDPPFVRGLNNPRYQEKVISRTKASIDTCVEFGVPNVIAFNGYKWIDAEDPASGEIPPEEGAANCVRALRALADYAEPNNVTVCLEMLNTRDDTHPMRGHPGYQGDDIDYCAEIVKRVDSPRVKLLFDIYHVQVMNGDVIRRIRQYADLIGHVHTAGAPGRGEIDETQELNYPAIMRALLEVGYTGYVGHEFMPTREPEQMLAHAVELCDV